MPNSQPTRQEIIASTVLFAAFFVGTAVNFFTNTGLFSSEPAKLSKWVFIAASILVFFIFYCIRLGRRWAKILWLVLNALGLLLTLLDFKRIAVKQLTTTPATVNFVLQQVIQVVMLGAVLYSFRKSRQGWDTQMQAAQQAGQEPESELL